MPTVLTLHRMGNFSSPLRKNMNLASYILDCIHEVKEKICVDCGESFPATEEFFPIHWRKTGRLKSVCIDCYRLRDKSHVNGGRRKVRKLCLADWRHWKCSMKLCCVICGYDDCVSALDFHHLDPQKKDFNFSEYFRRPFTAENRQIVLDEIKKCVVLCANCHRELHAEFGVFGGKYELSNF